MAADVRQRWVIDGAGAVKSLREIKSEGAASIAALEKNAADAGKTIADMGKKAAIAAAAIGIGFGVSALKLASDFQSAFAGVRKVLPKESDFAGIETGLRDMAKQVPIAVTDLAALAETAGQLGVRGKDSILSFTRVMADLGKTTNIVGQEGATSFARFVGLLPAAQQDFSRVGSAIVELGNSSKTTEAEILLIAQRMAGAGVAAGLTGPQILGLGAAMSSVGVQAEAGGTVMNQFFNQIKQASIEGGKSLEGLAKIAELPAEAFRKMVQTDPGAAINKFVVGLQHIEKSGGSAATALEKVGIDGARGALVFQGLAAAGDLVSKSMDTATKAFAANSALAEEAKKRYETFASKVAIAFNILKDVALTVGEEALKVLGGGLDDVTTNLREFAKSDELKRFAQDAARFLGEAVTALKTFGGFLIEHRESILFFGKAIALVFAATTISKWVTSAGNALAGMAINLGGFADKAVAAGGGVKGLTAALGPGGLITIGVLAIGAVTLAFDKLREAQIAAMKAEVEAGAATKDYVIALKGVAAATGEKLSDITGRYKDLDAIQKAAASGFVPAAQAGIDALNKQKEATVAAGAATKALAFDAAALGIAGPPAFKKTGQSAEDASAAAKKFSEAVKSATESLLSQAGVLSKADVAVKVRAFADAVEILKSRSLEASPAMAKLRADFGELVVNADASHVSLGKMTPALAEMAAATRALTFDAAALGIAGPPALEKMTFNAAQLGIAGPPAIEKVRTAFDDMVASMAAGVLGSTSLAGALGAIGKALLSVSDSGKGFGGFFDSLKKQFSTEGKSSGERLTAGIGSAMSAFADTSKPFGARIGGGVGAGIGEYFGGPLGAALGGKIGGLIGGLFGGKPMYAKIQKDVESNLGVALSEGTAKAIEQVAKDGGFSRQIATLLSFDKVIAEAKIGTENVGKFAGEFGKLASLAASGGKGAAEATAAIGKAFVGLVDKMEAAGLSGKRAYSDAVNSARQFAATVPEIGAWFDKAAQAGSTAFAKLLQAANIDAPGALERLGQIGSAAVAVIAASGVNGRAALEAMGPGLDKIVEKARELGKEIPAALAQLIGDREFQKANVETYDQLSALVDITRDWGKANWINAEAFMGIQASAIASFEQLTAAGRAPALALKDMAPVLQEIINEAGRNGKAIDANTQGLIQQAAQLGLVKVAGTDAFAAMRTESNYLLGGIAAIFGKQGVFRQYLTETSAHATGAVGQMQQSFAGGFAGIQASATAGLGAVKDVHAGIVSSFQAGTKAAIDTTAALVGDTSSKVNVFAQHIRDQFDGVRRQKRDLDVDFGGGGKGGLGPETHAGGGMGPGVIGAGEWAMDRQSTAFYGPANLARMMSDARRGGSSSQASAGSGPVSVSVAAGAAPNVSVTAVLRLGEEDVRVIVERIVTRLADRGGLAIPAGNLV